MQRCELTRFQMRWCFLSEVALLVDCQVAGQRTTKSMLLHQKEIFFPANPGKIKEQTWLQI